MGSGLFPRPVEGWECLDPWGHGASLRLYRSRALRGP
jgi:hypothetical protein